MVSAGPTFGSVPGSSRNHSHHSVDRGLAARLEQFLRQIQGAWWRPNSLDDAVSRDGGTRWENVRNLETDQNHTYAYTSVLFHKDRVLLSYYAGDGLTGRYSSRFRSLPVRLLYAEQ